MSPTIESELDVRPAAKAKKYSRGRRDDPKCRVCGCSRYDRCPAGCTWEPNQDPVCTNCRKMLRELKRWMLSARKVKWAALQRELRKPPLWLRQMAGGAE